MARPVQDIAADIASVTRLVESGQLASEAGRRTLASLAEELTAATRAAGAACAESPTPELRPEPPATHPAPLPAAGPAVRSAGPLGWALTAVGCVSVWFVVATAVTGVAMTVLVWFGTVVGPEVVEALSPFGAGLAQLGGFAAAQRFVNWRRARGGAAPIRWMFWLGVVAAVLVFNQDAQHSAHVVDGGQSGGGGSVAGRNPGGAPERGVPADVDLDELAAGIPPVVPGPPRGGAPGPEGDEREPDRPPVTRSLAEVEDEMRKIDAAFQPASAVDLPTNFGKVDQALWEAEASKAAARLTAFEFKIWKEVFEAEVCEGHSAKDAATVARSVASGAGTAVRWRVAVTPDERATGAELLIARSVRCGYTPEAAQAMAAARIQLGHPLILPAR